MNTPWTHGDDGSIWDNNCAMVAKASAFGWSDADKMEHADLIVRAVNSHQALIDALEKILMRATGDGKGSTLDELSRDFYHIRAIAKAAIKLAKGEA